MSGFFASDPVRTALIAGGLTAVICGVAGVFVVLRGQAFAGHAVGDMGTLGGSGAYLINVSPLWGYVAVGAAVAAAMELLGVQRRRERDVVTGIVLGAALGVAALLLYLDTTSSSTTGAAIGVLFGSLFTLGPIAVPESAALAGAGLLAVAVLYRPLLLSSVDPELASVRGVPVRSVATGFLLVMGVTVSLASTVVGTVLSPALLVGPAAAALRLTRRPLSAMAAAAAMGLAATWAGIALSYASVHWPPAHQGWPVSFFVVAIVFLLYAVVEVGAPAFARARRTTQAVTTADSLAAGVD
jgi:zinc/manganese transport system permease protein